MPDITTVWVVHLEQGNPLDTKGTLALHEAEVAFSGEDGREMRIPLRRVRQIKRVLGSPIMIIAHDGDDGTAAHRLLLHPAPSPAHRRGGEQDPAKARQEGERRLPRAAERRIESP